MKEITVDEVRVATGARIVGEGTGKISSVVTDSRKALNGSLFVAIKGERVDGHDYIGDVFKNGAAAVLCDHVPEGVTGPCLVVGDTIKALQDLARWYRTTLDIKIVGITGSVGKTSTKEMVASVLGAAFNVHKTLGNFNNEIGLPLTVLDIDADCEIAVLEMGISDFGEMRLLASIAVPDVCVITNIGQSHLENLGTRDGILKAKTEMFEFRNPEGPIFLNGDDDKLITVKDVAGTIPKFYGFNESNYAHVKNVVSRGLNGTDMTVVLGDREFDAGISMIGNHNVANACVAAAIGEYFGMSTDAIVKGLKDASTIAGRSNLIALKNGFLIDDCYNAAPTSMRAAIDTLCLGEGKRVAILGDMFELGSDEAAMHREIGEYAASKPVDTIVCVGDLSHNTYEGALTGNCREVRYFKTLDEVLESIDDIVRDAGVILVKASNGMHFSKITEKITLIMSKEENGNVAGHF